MKLQSILFLTSLMALTSACRQEPPPTPRQTAAPAAVKDGVTMYLVSGVLRKIDTNDNTAIIQHEEIPGYMAAMTMPFAFKDPGELAGVNPGDGIVFRLNVTEDDSWIDKVKKASNGDAPPPQREPVRLVRNVEELKVGDPLPDYRFTNELGKTVNLADFRGRAVALTFIFTRCPLPNFCPLMSKNFAEVYQLLKADPNAPTNWHLLSLSFDPHFDTPKVLKGYAERYSHDPQKWNFITGAMIDIDAITEQFGVAVAVEDGQWDHKLRTVVVDASGHIQLIAVGNQWKAPDLAEEIIKAARVQ